MDTGKLTQILRDQLDVVVDCSNDVGSDPELYPREFAGTTMTDPHKVENVLVEAWSFDVSDTEGNVFQITVDKINWADEDERYSHSEVPREGWVPEVVVTCTVHNTPAYIEVSQNKYNGHIVNQIDSNVCSGSKVDENMNLIDPKCGLNNYIMGIVWFDPSSTK